MIRQFKENQRKFTESMFDLNGFFFFTTFGLVSFYFQGGTNIFRNQKPLQDFVWFQKNN